MSIDRPVAAKHATTEEAALVASIKKHLKANLESAEDAAINILKAQETYGSAHGTWQPWYEKHLPELSRSRVNQFLRFGKWLKSTAARQLTVDQKHKKWQEIQGHKPKKKGAAASASTDLPIDMFNPDVTQKEADAVASKIEPGDKAAAEVLLKTQYQAALDLVEGKYKKLVQLLEFSAAEPEDYKRAPQKRARAWLRENRKTADA